MKGKKKYYVIMEYILENIKMSKYTERKCILNDHIPKKVIVGSYKIIILI